MTIAFAALDVLDEVLAERASQDDRWGIQDHPDICSDWRSSPAMARGGASLTAQYWKDENDRRVKEGSLAFDGILLEEVYEALEHAGADQVKLREELVQVAAVATCWVEAIDRRAAHVG